MTGTTRTIHGLPIYWTDDKWVTHSCQKRRLSRAFFLFEPTADVTFPQTQRRPPNRATVYPVRSPRGQCPLVTQSSP